MRVRRYYYEDDPRLCRSPEGGPLVRFTDLTARYGAHRFLVIGTSDGFFHPLTAELMPWTRAFTKLTSRTILNARPMRAWSCREDDLHALGFTSAPASPRGMAAYGDSVATGRDKEGDVLLDNRPRVVTTSPPRAARKRIVVCCDGTWNNAETRTSISRLADLIISNGDGDIEQRCMYVAGMGTGSFNQLSGGLFGVGISNNIKEAYRFLVRNYEPGDEFFCFGFARGAYTARSLCGLLEASGLLRVDSNSHIDTAFEYYRSVPENREGSSYLRRLQSVPRHTLADGLRVKMLGVFDTVGWLGVPVQLLAGLIKWRRVGFDDACLSALVENAYHALAVDEERGIFQPMLWTDVARDGNGEPVPQAVVQAWFPGVHSDVGGGYGDKTLADVSFLWMIREAQKLGLEVDQAKLDREVAPDPFGKAHDSLSAVYKFAAWWPWVPVNGPRAIGNAARPTNARINSPEALH